MCEGDTAACKQEKAVTLRPEERGPIISDADELRERAAEFLRSYQHGTDDAPAIVAGDIARLPTPYAIAVTAAMCEQLDDFERLEFTNRLLEVAAGEYSSVFDRASD